MIAFSSYQKLLILIIPLNTNIMPRKKENIEALDSKIKRINELMLIQRPIHGGVMGRRRIEDVWNALDTLKPLRIDEIAEKLGIKGPVVQKALYILMAEGRAVRAPIITNRNIGRPIYEYTKINIPTVESVDGTQHRITEEMVVSLLPRAKEDALTAFEIAEMLQISSNTARMKLAIAEARGDVIGIRSVNPRNQAVKKYYRSK